MSDFRTLVDRAMRDVEAKQGNDVEAHAVLALIVAEFQTDPTSVACFDLQIVKRAADCVAIRRDLVDREVVL